MKFYARADMLLPEPKARAVVGQFPRYVGRKLVPAEIGPDGKVTKPPSWPATEEPWECPDTGHVAMSIIRQFGKAKALKQEPPLWPADEATAALCGVTFVKITVKDGVAAAVEKGL